MEIAKAEIQLKSRVSFWQAVKRQYAYKRKVHMNLFGVIVLIMLSAGLILIGTNQHISFQDNVHVEVEQYTSGMVVSLYLVMMFIVGIQLTVRRRRAEMVMMYTNKSSNHLANGLLLLTLAAVISVLAYLIHYATLFGYYMLNGSPGVVLYAEKLNFSGFLVTIIVTFLYLLLLASLGYLVGETVQFSKVFLFIWIVFGFIIMNQDDSAQGIIASTVTFYSEETDVSMFVLKMIPSIIVLFLLATIINRKKGVRA